MQYDGASEFWRDDQPWDEFAWEAFMQEQDGRIERYMELEAKYGGRPDAEEWIAREMGWEFPPCFGSDAPDCDECDKRFTCEWNDADSGESGAASEAPSGVADEPAAHVFEDDAVWQRAHDLAVRLHHYFELRRGAGKSAGVAELLNNAAMITAKIAGGRSMGFSRDALGGNIANHKRAMRHALVCLGALDEAAAAGAAPYRAVARFRATLLGLREGLMDRIVELQRLFYSGKFLDE